MKRLSKCFRNGVFIAALAVAPSHAQPPSPSSPGQTVPGAADPRGPNGPHSGASGSTVGTAQSSPQSMPNPVAPGSGVTQPSSSGSSSANGNAGYDTNRRGDQNLGWIGILGVIDLGGLFRSGRSRDNDRVNDPPRNP